MTESRGVKRRARELTAAMGVQFSEEMIARLDRVAAVLSKGGIRVSRSEVIRLAAKCGLELLETPTRGGR